MTTKPLDLAQFEGQSYKWDVQVKSGAAGGNSRYANVTLQVQTRADTIEEVRAFVAAAPALLSECKRQREQITALVEIGTRILGAHDSKNNGAYMGEAVLCSQYAEQLRAALKATEGA